MCLFVLVCAVLIGGFFLFNMELLYMVNNAFYFSIIDIFFKCNFFNMGCLVFIFNLFIFLFDFFYLSIYLFIFLLYAVQFLMVYPHLMLFLDFDGSVYQYHRKSHLGISKYVYSYSKLDNLFQTH